MDVLVGRWMDPCGPRLSGAGVADGGRGLAVDPEVDAVRWMLRRQGRWISRVKRVVLGTSNLKRAKITMIGVALG